MSYIKLLRNAWHGLAISLFLLVLIDINFMYESLVFSKMSMTLIELQNLHVQVSINN